MKCRAAVLHKMGAPEPYSNSRPIEIEEIELDPPGEGEVLIKSPRRACVILIYPSLMAQGLAHYRW